MKRLLLTGIGGSIGCHAMVHFLHNTNWEVVGIDSFRHKGMTDRVEKMLSYHPEYRRRVSILSLDLNQSLAVGGKLATGKIDYFVMMASLSDVHDSILDPVPFVKNNVNIALTCLEYARKARPVCFILVSTDEIYGPTDGKELHKEWDAIVPSNPYSASKVAQEAIAISYWRTYNVPLIVVNLMNNFGEMQSPSKFPCIVQRKVRLGETVGIHTNKSGENYHAIGSRYYIHSRNSSDALLFLLRNVIPNLHVDGEVDRPPRFNIVGERQVDNLSLAQLIANQIGKPLKYELIPSAASRPGHDIHYGLDGSKLADLGWKPPVSFEESMQRTVEWYEVNPEWLDPNLGSNS